MSRLVVVVPRTRAYCGRLVLLGSDGKARLGPLRALATASRRVARRHGNDACDPLRPFGHPPAGTYLVSTTLPPGYAHPRRPRRFGSVGALLMAPTGGDARTSLANGRRVFAVHGGPLDTARRLRPTRGGLRLSDDDMSALFRAINAAYAEGDPLGTVEILEVGESDLRAVPALDLRGARRALGIPHKARKRGASRDASAPSREMLMIALGLGAATAGDRNVDRRQLLQAALVLVGGLAVTACNRSSPCTPLACDPGDPPGDPPDGGGAGDAAGDARLEGSAAGADAMSTGDGEADGSATDGGVELDGGVPPEAGAPPDAGLVVDAGTRADGGGGGRRGPDGGTGAGTAVPCPPSGYVCEEDDTYGTYVAGGGTG